MNLWNDGRSGPAGCFAGNLVLAHLRDTRQEQFATRKGTTFFGRSSIWVGRVCSTDSYLGGRDKHWANLSFEQHHELAAEARLHGYALNYLFITAQQHQPVIHYWVIPADIIERLGFAGQHEPNAVFALHIREDEKLSPGRYTLETEDVTRYHHVLELRPGEQKKLDESFETMKRAKQRRDTGSAPASGARPAERAAGEFEIHLGSGRSALLTLPLPAAPVDLNRIKGWIDLMQDVLTETVPARQSGADALSSLQRNAVRTQKALLADEEVDEEIAKVRREGK
ncbi:MAG TPA: hypothetical protein VF669_11645 [Tepidisphaeraceae bacterium]|jgi:hypothetical protein